MRAHVQWVAATGRTRTVQHEIDHETQERTKHYMFGFAYIRSVAWEGCAVEQDINRSILNVKPHGSCSCSYHVYLGDAHVCTCPTRPEIYPRHGA